jgi:hypothetical protein
LEFHEASHGLLYLVRIALVDEMIGARNESTECTETTETAERAEQQLPVLLSVIRRFSSFRPFRVFCSHWKDAKIDCFVRDATEWQVTHSLAMS